MAREFQKDVKRDGKVVCSATAVEFASLDDARSYVGDDAKLLKLIARAVFADNANRARLGVATPEKQAAKLLGDIRKGKSSDVAALQALIAQIVPKAA